MNKDVTGLVLKFKEKFPMTIAWRVKKHAKVVEKHINPDETVLYAFAGQKGPFYRDIFHTYVIALTDKRLVLAEKRLLFGYLYLSITPDLFNDLSVGSGLIWGKVVIDTLSEQVVITNIDKAALAEVETNISTYMMEAKQKYQNRESQ